jgi:hypothetical protein
VVVGQDYVAELVVVQVSALVVAQMEVRLVCLPGGDCETVAAVEGAEVEFSCFLHIGVPEDDLS